jgi:hypothetical protein
MPARGRLFRLAQALDRSVTICLFLFALAQPLSIAGAQIAYSVAALCWVARIGLVRRGILHSSPLDGPILVYWLLCAIATLFSPLPASSWEGMRKISLIFLVLVAAQNVSRLERVRQLLAVLFLSALVTLGYSGWQYAAGIGLRVISLDRGDAYRAGIREGAILFTANGRRLRAPDDLVTVLRARPPGEDLTLGVVPPGLEIAVAKDAKPAIIPAREFSEPLGAESIGMRVIQARPLRAHGFYSHYVTYSEEMQLLLALAFGLWLSSRRHLGFPALGFAALALACALGLGATLTRSAWLAAAFACVVQVWFHVRTRWVRIFLPGALILAALGTNTAMRHWRGVGLIDFQEGSSEYRMLMWRDGLRLIGQHPWFGVGMNTVRDAWQSFDLAAYRLTGIRSHFHSTPIQIAVELGVPVLLAWLALMGSYWWMLAKLVRSARDQADTTVYGISLGILGGTSGFLLSSLVQYNFGDSVAVLLFWFLMGLALALRRHLEQAPGAG